MPRQRTCYNRRTDDFPQTPGTVPRGVRPVIVGDCPTHRDLSPHRVALEDWQGKAQRGTHDGPPQTSPKPGPRPTVHRLRCRSARAEVPSLRTPTRLPRTGGAEGRGDPQGRDLTEDRVMVEIRRDDDNAVPHHIASVSGGARPVQA